MSDSIKLTVTLSANPKVVYNAFLNSEEHSAFTKSKVEIEKKLHSDFTAFDGYIKGKIELLHINKRIFLSWRTTEFEEEQSDSHVQIFLGKVEKGTKFSLHHIELPEGTGEKYKMDWKDNYLTPMKEYFENK